MKLEIKTGDKKRTPGREFRKWVLIGAVAGAVLAGMAALLTVGVAMAGGAIVGAAVGVVFGIIKAAMALVSRN